MALAVRPSSCSWSRDIERLLKAVGIALLVALLGSSADEVVSFKKAFFDRDAIRTLRTQLDSLSQPGQYSLVNHMWDSAYAYYFDRNTVLLALNGPEHADEALAYYTDPRRTRESRRRRVRSSSNTSIWPTSCSTRASITFWRATDCGRGGANPERCHAQIDAFIKQRDSVLVAKVSRIGHRVYDSDFYALWVIPPGAVSSAAARTPSPSPRN